MTARRNDDLAAFVSAREAELAGGKPRKVLQVYEAYFAARVPSGISADDVTAAAAIDKLLTDRNRRWQFRELSYGPGWISGKAAYEAKGANADDLDRKLQAVLGVGEGGVAIDTISVRPVGDVVL